MIGAVLALVAAVAIGLILAFSGSGASAQLTEATFPGYKLSFRYPSTWKRKDWCWIGTSVFPLTLLTTARAAPTCEQDSSIGSGTPLPPPQRLGRDSVVAWWFASNQSKPHPLRPNASLDGRPARITVEQQPTHRTERSYVNCTTGTTQRFLTAQIQGRSSGVDLLDVGAVICGPDFASGLADVRKMLDSVRFAS